MSSVKKPKSSIKQETNSANSLARYDKRVQLAIPLRVITCDGEKRPQIDMACTLDISLRGARLYGVRPTMRVGEVVTVERGRSKFFCRVIWIGAPDSAQKGQIGVQAVESGKCLWENEIREVSDQFGPINADTSLRAASGDRKRKFQRLQADAQARVLPQRPGMPDGELASGRIKNISETGCLLTSSAHFEIGAHVQVVVDLPNSDVALRGRVRHIGPEGLGIEFREIRKSDRQLLRYWLHQIGSPAVEVPVVVS
jgi:PilZ domain